MSRLTANQLVIENIELISLPEVMIHINEMIDDPNCSAADIGQVVGEDPALTARLLRIVNSPMYGFPSQIQTISMAITVLGTRQLRDLVLATTVVDQFRTLAEDVVDMETYWCHSICTALGAKIIGSNIKVNNSERFFVAGLLHDIGKLAMYTAYPDPSRQVMELAHESEIKREYLEKSIFGFTHAEVGAELLQHWHLPKSLVEPTHFHHHPAQARSFALETAAVHIADCIANNIQSPVSADDDYPIQEAAWSALGLDPTILERLHEEIYAQLDDSLNAIYYDHAA